MSQAPDNRKHLTEQEVYNISFDNTYDTMQVEMIGYDSETSSLVRLNVSANGAVNISSS